MYRFAYTKITSLFLGKVWEHFVDILFLRCNISEIKLVDKLGKGGVNKIENSILVDPKTMAFNEVLEQKGKPTS